MSLTSEKLSSWLVLAVCVRGSDLLTSTLTQRHAHGSTPRHVTSLAQWPACECVAASATCLHSRTKHARGYGDTHASLLKGCCSGSLR